MRDRVRSGSTDVEDRSTLFQTLILPSAADTGLLRACLLEGESGRLAFAAWAERPTEALAHLKENGGLKRRLLPLLQAAALRQGLAVPAELEPPLRAAALYEQLRTEAYREIVADVLQTLHAAKVDFLALRGVAFSTLLYQEAGLRHCHDVDLLVREESRDAAADLLGNACGFALREQTGAPEGSLLLYHTSGLPLMLHTRALPHRAMRFRPEQLRESQVQATTCGVPTATPAPAMALLQTLLHGPFTTQGGSLIWLCDAYRLLLQNELDWKAFCEAIDGDAELLAVLTALGYLSSELQAKVPAVVLSALEERWSRLPPSIQNGAEDLLLLLLMQQGVAGKLKLLHVARGHSHNLRALRIVFVPPAAALRQIGKIQKDTVAPLFWVRQAFGMLRRNIP